MKHKFFVFANRYGSSKPPVLCKVEVDKETDRTITVCAGPEEKKTFRTFRKAKAPRVGEPILCDTPEEAVLAFRESQKAEQGAIARQVEALRERTERAEENIRFELAEMRRFDITKSFDLPFGGFVR